jgi:hypothetical protein
MRRASCKPSARSVRAACVNLKRGSRVASGFAFACAVLAKPAREPTDGLNAIEVCEPRWLATAGPAMRRASRGVLRAEPRPGCKNTGSSAGISSSSARGVLEAMKGGRGHAYILRQSEIDGECSLAVSPNPSGIPDARHARQKSLARKVSRLGGTSIVGRTTQKLHASTRARTSLMKPSSRRGGSWSTASSSPRGSLTRRDAAQRHREHRREARARR